MRNAMWMQIKCVWIVYCAFLMHVPVICESVGKGEDVPVLQPISAGCVVSAPTPQEQEIRSAEEKIREKYQPYLDALEKEKSKSFDIVQQKYASSLEEMKKAREVFDKKYTSLAQTMQDDSDVACQQVYSKFKPRFEALQKEQDDAINQAQSVPRKKYEAQLAVIDTEMLAVNKKYDPLMQKVDDEIEEASKNVTAKYKSKLDAMAQELAAAIDVIKKRYEIKDEVASFTAMINGCTATSNVSQVDADYCATKAWLVAQLPGCTVIEKTKFSDFGWVSFSKRSQNADLTFKCLASSPVLIGLQTERGFLQIMLSDSGGEVWYSDHAEGVAVNYSRGGKYVDTQKITSPIIKYSTDPATVKVSLQDNILNIKGPAGSYSLKLNVLSDFASKCLEFNGYSFKASEYFSGPSVWGLAEVKATVG